MDNDVNKAFAKYFQIPYYKSPLVHTGGNMMATEGQLGSSTTLFHTENKRDGAVENMEKFYGIKPYGLFEDPTGHSIRHIDCW